MGQLIPQRPVLTLIAIFSRYPEALQWARDTGESQWGPIALASDEFVFDQTSYYERDMGSNLFKQMVAFEQLRDPAELADWKIASNQWEEQYRATGDFEEARPLNIDPGYVTEAKLVLASTKDRDHRIYLRDGIFAEGTLYFHRGKWSDRSWTYPDFATQHYKAFLTECRDYLRQRYRQELAADGDV